MIVVTGGNMVVGRLVAGHLLDQLPAGQVTVTAREPRKAGPLKDRGADVRHADPDEPATMVRAFKGADTVLINGTNYDIDPATRSQRQTAAITAAAESGAGRLVITTWQDLDHCLLPQVSDYPATETRAMAAGIPATILRLTCDLAALVAREVRWAVAAGTLIAPAGRARTTPAAITDLAEGTANVLREAGHEGVTYELTGPDAVSWDDLAALASSISGKKVRYQPVEDREYREHVTALGLPEVAIGMLLDYYAAVRGGWASSPTSDLAQLLHRAPAGTIEAIRRAAVASAGSPAPGSAGT
jgi:NAD(P)H dehydrogenase (quinone)